MDHIRLVCLVLVAVQISVAAAESGGMSWTTVTNRTLTLVQKCLDRANSTECFRGKLLKALDMATNNSDDWQLSEFLTIRRNPEYTRAGEDGVARDSRQDYDENSISGKLNELLRSRRVQFQTNLVPTSSEGRRKKQKHGGMMMFGGLTMAALYAQVVLGKITMLAAAAFVLAKIALFVSATKHAGSTGSSTTEHIVYSDHSGGHSDPYRRNGFRSMGQYEVPPPYPYEASDELKDRDIRLVEAEE